MKSFSLSLGRNRSSAKEQRFRLEVREPTMEDAQLDRVLAGDMQAFRYFVERYQDMAFSIAVGVVKNRAEAEDVVQEAFVKAFRGIQKFKRDAKFSSWLYRIVTNEALSRMRTKRAKSTHLDVVELEERLITDLDNAMKRLERDEQRTAIERILAVMKPKEALVLQLHYLKEQSIAEIEASTGFSKANVKVLLHRGRHSFYHNFQIHYGKETI